MLRWHAKTIRNGGNEIQESKIFDMKEKINFRWWMSVTLRRSNLSAKVRIQPRAKKVVLQIVVEQLNVFQQRWKYRSISRGHLGNLGASNTKSFEILWHKRLTGAKRTSARFSWTIYFVSQIQIQVCWLWDLSLYQLCQVRVHNQDMKRRQEHRAVDKNWLKLWEPVSQRGKKLVSKIPVHQDSKVWPSGTECWRLT